ncbi:MAG: hypothetical protein HYZ92_07065 [Candidatus Omnitrophica bacterium]|nr:hypothetical protein [Candidatus Omnitrophota bacterium]
MSSTNSSFRFFSLVTGHWSLVAIFLLVTGLTGCESVTRKFTRKPKHAPERPSPVTSFQDYAGSVTPLERYRKHYMLFEYWNAELVDEMRQPMMNGKRARHASHEALQELGSLRELLQPALLPRLEPILEQRRSLDGQLRADALTASQRETTLRLLDEQLRHMHRELYWRKVEDKLHSPAASAEPTASSN